MTITFDNPLALKCPKAQALTVEIPGTILPRRFVYGGSWFVLDCVDVRHIDAPVPQFTAVPKVVATYLMAGDAEESDTDIS